MRPLDFYRMGLAASTAVSEPVQRMAVNRLYYGLHHEACCRYFREYPAAEPLTRSRRHTGLADRFVALNTSESWRAARLLNDLRRLRAESDYNLVLPISIGNRNFDARQLLDQALVTSSNLLDVLDVFSPGEAEDGCNCPQA